MKIKQALKQKNVLTAEIAELNQLIRSSNSTVVGNPKHYKVVDLMTELNSKILELVGLKDKIHKANSPVYDKIFLLSELKGQVNVYKGISTVEGKMEGNRYSNSEPSVMEVELNVIQVKAIIKGLEVKINEIQEELDYHNATTDI
jgi:hypothetical protein